MGEGYGKNSPKLAYLENAEQRYHAVSTLVLLWIVTTRKEGGGLEKFTMACCSRSIEFNRVSVIYCFRPDPNMVREIKDIQII